MFIKELRARSFLYTLFANARFSHAKKYLLNNLLHKSDPYKTFVLSKDKSRSLNIWALQQVKHRTGHYGGDFFFWRLNEESWLANLEQVHGLYEYLNGTFETIYACDYTNKTVLDIGGYIGDSARFFLRQNARKIFIYEPVKKNIVAMQHNLQDHFSKVRMISKGVSAKGETMTIESSYPEGHIGFGCEGRKFRVTIETEGFDTILRKEKYDIAKIDCEGNEKYLLQVGAKNLQKIPYWMIEIHHPEMIQKLQTKFLEAGFKMHVPLAPEGHLSVFHFVLT